MCKEGYEGSEGKGRREAFASKNKHNKKLGHNLYVPPTDVRLFFAYTIKAPDVVGDYALSVDGI